MKIPDYNVANESQNVELLKKYFGESALGVCEVMMKDMGDSRRVDNLIRGNTTFEVKKNGLKIHELLFIVPFTSYYYF